MQDEADVGIGVLPQSKINMTQSSFGFFDLQKLGTETCRSGAAVSNLLFQIFFADFECFVSAQVAEEAA